jgi:hypothetical protein
VESRVIQPRKKYRFEIHAIVKGELNIYLTDKVDFGLEGYVKVIPKFILTSTTSGIAESIEITLPRERIEIIIENRGKHPTP